MVNVRVNGLHLYCTFLTSGQSTLEYCLTFTHSCTHPHTGGAGNHAKRQPARREQWCLAQGHLDTHLGIIEPAIELATFLVTGQPALPPGLVSDPVSL